MAPLLILIFVLAGIVFAFVTGALLFTTVRRTFQRTSNNTTDSSDIQAPVTRCSRCGGAFAAGHPKCPSCGSSPARL